MLCQFERLVYPTGANPSGYMVALYKPCETVRDASGSVVSRIKAVGYCLPIAGNLRFDMHGHWNRNAKHGIQFEVEAYDEVIVPTREGIVAYLSSGQIKGIGPKMAEKIYTEYGSETMDIVKNHPYRLCELVGIGFKTADRIASGMGFDPLSTERVDEGILFTLTDAETRGNLCMEKHEFIKACRKLLDTRGLTDTMIANRAARLVHDSRLTPYGNSIFRSKTAAQEAHLACTIHRYLKRSVRFSWIQKAILDIYRRNHPDREICCCAPTGRAARRMELYHMADILPLLGLPQPQQGRSSYYVQCPCCDEDPRKSHLNINLKKDVFRCPRCGVYGGVFDLYALYTGTPRDKVRKAIADRLGTEPRRVQTETEPQPELREYPPTDIETRHATYSALLSMLTLAPDHRQNLLNRGLKDADIERLGYKTTPIVGTTVIAKQLQDNGFYLAGVPGFYRNEEGNWAFIHERRGILIPVRDKDGFIQGLQIRRDDVQKRKFRWVSSSDMQDGCRAEGWTHLAGPIRPILLLTEGPMKADVINALSNLSVLAVPGVNTLTQLQSTLEQLRIESLQEIKTAFDMDFLTNAYVQNGLQNLFELLDSMGFRYGTYVWDPRYKGLDDYLWEYCIKKPNPPPDMSKMSAAELDAELEKGYADRKARRTIPAEKAFADVRRE